MAMDFFSSTPGMHAGACVLMAYGRLLMLRLLAPLRHLGIRTAPIGFAMALVIRFTPVLFAKAGTLIDAWRARSPRRPGWQVVMPIALLAIDDAEHVAEALRARGGLDTEP